MNALMFKKCYGSQRDNLIPFEFVINDTKTKEIPYYGLPKKNKNEK